MWLVPALAGIPLAYAAALAYDAIVQKHAANRGLPIPAKTILSPAKATMLGLVCRGSNNKSRLCT